MMKYMTVTKWSAIDLDEAVNAQIEQGWEPLGGVSMVATPSDEDGLCDTLYAQTMIKAIPPDAPPQFVFATFSEPDERAGGEVTTTQLQGREVVAKCYELLGYRVEMRHISRDPECGGWDEVQSIYEEEIDGAEHLADRPQDWCYFCPNPYATPPYTDDDYIWKVVPEDDDLFAAFELQAELGRRGLVEQFASALSSEVAPDLVTLFHGSVELITFDMTGWDFVWAVANATAEQRARAALKVLQEAND